MTVPDWYTPEWAAAAAGLAAHTFLGTAPGVARTYPREHWQGVAWERIDRDARRGCLAGLTAAEARGMAGHAGRCGCVDWLRQATRHRAWVRAGSPPPAALALLDFADYMTAPPRVDDPDRRLLTLWCDTRRERLAMGLSLVARVRLYLWLVEGWDQAEIGAAWGCGRNAVCHSLAPAVRRAGPAAALAFHGTRSGAGLRTRAAPGRAPR